MKSKLEYIWLDCENNARSKTKVLTTELSEDLTLAYYRIHRKLF